MTSQVRAMRTIDPMTEHQHGKAILDEVIPLGRVLREAIPDVYQGFAAFSDAAYTPGALDVKSKQLIGFAVAVALQCDGCIAAHARSAVKAGASKQEGAEAIGVAMTLLGGPGTVHGPRAYDAFCEFVDARDELPPPTPPSVAS
jgi:AhpD family alkylhydroperoxidase